MGSQQVLCPHCGKFAQCHFKDVGGMFDYTYRTLRWCPSCGHTEVSRFDAGDVFQPQTTTTACLYCGKLPEEHRHIPLPTGITDLGEAQTSDERQIVVLRKGDPALFEPCAKRLACPFCRASGTIACPDCSRKPRQTKCPNCNATGLAGQNTGSCSCCWGSGSIDVPCATCDTTRKVPCSCCA